MKWYTNILLIIFFPAIILGQGHYNQENFGNRSLLLSGNVTGSVDDLGLTYYNPARIALVENPVFSINAKGYQLGFIDIKNAFGNNEKLSDSKFEGVPSMIAGTVKFNKLKKHHFAYSFLSKQRSKVELGYSTEKMLGDGLDEVDGIERSVEHLNLKHHETDEWFGLTWGTRIRDNLSVGVSGFVSVYNYKGSNSVRASALDDVQDVDFYNNEIFFGQTSYGMFWKLGVAWLLPKFDLGLNIDLPYWEMFSSGKFKYEQYLSGFGNGDDIFDYANFDDIEASRKEPLSLSVGAGIPLGKNKIHLKVDWHNKIGAYDRLLIPEIDEGTEGIKSFAFKEALKAVVNFGVGAEFYLSPKYNVYTSFSTDFSPVKSNANIFDLTREGDNDINIVADYYHLGLGVDMKLNWAQLILGTTFTTGSSEFKQAIDFPDQAFDEEINNDLSKITVSRWRIIIGIEIPIFDTKLEFK
ncbi:MAG: hypothetical protein OEM04_05890 [Flavobacteriaceae bacterium]|nr:hypothetical protein [Flavobacteriaceae bacterium]